MRKVIANSTPLIALCRIGGLDILRRLYGKIIIAEAVFREVSRKKDSVCRQIQENMTWIKVCRIQNELARGIFDETLHDGEVETMILALENPSALVLIDDYKARRKAKELGLRLTGTLGVLVKAKKTGMIPQVAPLALKLREQGIYIADNVLDMALRNADEEKLTFSI